MCCCKGEHLPENCQIIAVSFVANVPPHPFFAAEKNFPSIKPSDVYPFLCIGNTADCMCCQQHE